MKFSFLSVFALAFAGYFSASSATAQIGFAQNGMASYYSDRFHGRMTANGEYYDKGAMTAAHLQLPFGSMVLVQNLKNGKEVVVRVNDRGPFGHGRVIDLSKAAAHKLDMIHHGVCDVRVEVIGLGGRLDEPAVAKATRKKDPEIAHPDKTAVASAEKTPQHPEKHATHPDKAEHAHEKHAVQPEKTTPPAEKPAPQPEKPTASIDDDATQPKKPTVPAKKTDPQPPKKGEPELEIGLPFYLSGTYNIQGDRVELKGYGVQLGLFTYAENALDLCLDVRKAGYERVFVVVLETAGKRAYKVALGEYESLEVANKNKTEIETKGFTGFALKYL